MQNRKAITRSLFAAVAVHACALPVPHVCATEVDEARARKVQAAYLYNFAKFIEWPGDAFADSNAPFVIGVLNDKRFADVLAAAVRGKQIQGRGVEVRNLHWSEPADRDRVENCHALYIGRLESTDLTDVLNRLQQRPILTVSDMDAFAQGGGMIGFVVEMGRIVFEINVDAVEAAALKASSKLLKLARIVAKGS